ncbi:carboxypeptidase-like regulatory domain-containing protein [Solitalea sp. MAHUQ-68]|uniref:Carboxypeptidase-like regulatory domain-containing protein n=1 Tax=Solitalea agri TaxID=2953739 RepID=A0A9X2F248_9SPHI|nr:carboxypeptidase-like regulatory domain-containing protein [Solitalea agri]MCO4293279.1 carboxypeptidase-like regulatory domain-containing protein [Solitalea agri]
MKRCLHIICLCLLISCTVVNAQNITLKGKVVEDVPEAYPVPNATLTISNTKLIYSANKNGEFTLSIPEKNKVDSLVITSLGYKAKTISIKEMLKTPFTTVKLKSAYLQLDDIVVNAKKAQKIYLGSEKKSSFGKYCPFPELQHAFYIPNNNNTTGIIRSVRFFIRECENGVIDAPFRVRLYGKADMRDFPGPELIQDAIIARAQKNNEWLSVDISQYNVEVPYDGFFVVLEILPLQYYSTDVTSTETTYDGNKITVMHYAAPAIGYEKLEDVPGAVSRSWRRYGINKWERVEQYNYMMGANITSD